MAISRTVSDNNISEYATSLEIYALLKALVLAAEVHLQERSHAGTLISKPHAEQRC